MENMIEFSKAILALISEFLGTEPMIYLVGMIMFLFIVKVFLMLIDYDDK